MRVVTMVVSIALIAGPILTPFTPPRAARSAAAHASIGGVITLSGTPSVIAIDGVTARAIIGIHFFTLGRVAIVDTHRRRVLREIDVGTPPLAIRLAGGGHRVFVLTAGTDLTHWRGRLCILDATSGILQHSVPVGVNPNALAVDDSLGRVLVTTHTATAAVVAIFDAASLRRIAQLTLVRHARPIAVTAVAGRALVVTSTGRAYLIDDATARILHVTPVGQGAALIEVDERNGRVFVVNQVSDTVSVIDLVTGTLLKTVGVGLTPSGLGVDATVHRVLVANAADGTITLLDGRSGTRLRVVAVGTLPHGVVVDARSGIAAIPTTDGISIVDATTGALLRHITFGVGGVTAVAVGGQPATAIVAPVNESAVHLLDLAGLSRHAPMPAGPSERRSLAVLQAFVDAYNSHDLQGVLSTLADDINYGDCDYSAGISRIMRGKAAVQVWLRARFEEHDRFFQAHITVPGDNREPRGASLTAIRINDTLQAQGQLKLVGAKITLASDGGHLENVRAGGGPDCPSAVG